MADSLLSLQNISVSSAAATSKKHMIVIADEVLNIVTDEDSLVLHKAQLLVEQCCELNSLKHVDLLTTDQKKKKFLFAAFSFAIELIKSENNIHRLSAHLDHIESSKTI
jgi:hypothetical protein